MVKEEKARVPGLERPAEIEKMPEAPKEAPAIEVPKPLPTEAEVPTKALPSATVAPPTPAQPADPVLRQIETILAEDLEQVYAELPAELKPKFKAKGEEVARNIRAMMESAKVKARKVLKLIVGWLKIIPGVNKFFLEQEAAIKAQKIMTVAEGARKK